jgi:hypothetical protein
MGWGKAPSDIMSSLARVLSSPFGFRTAFSLLGHNQPPENVLGPLLARDIETPGTISVHGFECAELVLAA